jgi:hypothetical protein
MALPSYVVALSFGSSGFVDVTQYVQSVSISRGINRNLDDFSAGSLSVTFVNNARVFDPLNTSSPLWYGAGGYTMVQPSGRIRVSSNGVRRFTGYVQDWEFSYDESGFDATATVTALDLIYEIGQIEFANQPGKYFDQFWGIQPVVETTGDRINRVFNSTGSFAASQYALIERGKTIVGADVNTSGENVLSYMQNLARSEPADLFCNASGVMAMKEHNFINYSWANTTRNNLIVFPGTATSITVDELYDVPGWIYGGLEASQTPLLSNQCNQATVDTNLLRYAMQYVDLNKYKYNPDGTATNFTFSCFLRGSGLVTGSGLSGRVNLLDEFAQVLITTPVTATAVSSDDWTQVTVSNNYAGTGIVAGLDFRITALSNTGSYFFIGDGFIFERASSYVNYFDGTTNPVESSAATVSSVGWSNVPYASYSGLVTSVASTATGKATRTFADQNSQGAAYGNGTGIPFTDLQITYGSEQLYNEIEVIGVNATATVVDIGSQSLYGKRVFAQTDNLTTDVTRVQKIAEGFRADYRLPEYRANQISFALESLTSAEQTIVLGIEIRDVVRVCFQPSATGAIVDKYYQILGISSNTDVERDEVTFNVASLDNLGFRLDSPFLGILNTDTLA